MFLTATPFKNKKIFHISMLQICLASLLTRERRKNDKILTNHLYSFAKFQWQLKVPNKAKNSNVENYQEIDIDLKQVCIGKRVSENEYEQVSSKRSLEDIVMLRL